MSIGTRSLQYRRPVAPAASHAPAPETGGPVLTDGAVSRPTQKRSVEDLKERYYGVCAKLAKLRPQAASVPDSLRVRRQPRAPQEGAAGEAVQPHARAGEAPPPQSSLRQSQSSLVRGLKLIEAVCTLVV